jgi:hypothetical protein
VASADPASSSLLVSAVSAAGVGAEALAAPLPAACVVAGDAHWAGAPAAAEEARSWAVRVRADYFLVEPTPGGYLVEPQAGDFPAGPVDCPAVQRVADSPVEPQVADCRVGSSRAADCLADSAEDG